MLQVWKELVCCLFLSEILGGVVLLKFCIRSMINEKGVQGRQAFAFSDVIVNDEPTEIRFKR